MKKISVCIAYYNRPDYLRRTLSAYLNIHNYDLSMTEFIIIDDGSWDNLRAAPVCKEFSDRLDIKCFYRENKDDINPAVAINSSVRLASGEIIIIANPETMPVTPIIHQINLGADFQDNQYTPVSCYSVDGWKQNGINVLDINSPTYVEDILKIVELKPQQANEEGVDGWYSHPVYRPVLFYFMAVMKKEYFWKLGGIDEDFRYGWGYEDTDFVKRLLNDQPLLLTLPGATCLHQFHYYYQNEGNQYVRPYTTVWEGRQRNERLYLQKWGSF